MFSVDVVVAVASAGNVIADVADCVGVGVVVDVTFDVDFSVEVAVDVAFDVAVDVAVSGAVAVAGDVADFVDGGLARSTFS